MCEPEKCDDLINKLRYDNICADSEIVGVKSRGKTALTPNSPQLKITRLFKKSNHIDEVIVQLQEQNKWMEDLAFNLQEMITINSKKGAYKNIIIYLDVEALQVFMRRGKVIHNLSECRTKSACRICS